MLVKIQCCVIPLNNNFGCLEIYDLIVQRAICTKFISGKQTTGMTLFFSQRMVGKVP